MSMPTNETKPAAHTANQRTNEINGRLDVLGALAGPQDRPQDDPVPICDRCGNACDDGYSTRYYGNADPETGYRDQERICAACNEGDS